MKYYNKMDGFDLMVRWSFSLVPTTFQTCSHDSAPSLYVFERKENYDFF